MADHDQKEDEWTIRGGRSSRERGSSTRRDNAGFFLKRNLYKPPFYYYYYYYWGSLTVLLTGLNILLSDFRIKKLMFVNIFKSKS